MIFPVLHGPYGEDGTIQGLLELANVPYVGAGVAASALGMDKALMKVLFSARGLPVCDYRVVLRREWERRATRSSARARARARASRCSSSRPTSDRASAFRKPRTRAGLREAMDLAGSFDRKIVIEAAVPERPRDRMRGARQRRPEDLGARRGHPVARVLRLRSEVPRRGIEDVIPADLPPAVVDEIQRLSVAAFQAIDCAGMARVDFLLSRDSGAIVLNEVNTIPGFTTISMYSKMWEASGLSYPALIDRLIELALERHADKQQLRTSVT